jgi:hypothetical protein
VLPIGASEFEAIEEALIPDAARFNKSALAVKFCSIRSDPPNSTTAIRLFGPAFASINFVAALRALIWSGISIEELSKNKTR